MDDFFQGFGIVVGVFVGVVGGTSVALLTQWVNQRRNEGQQVKNLKFELGLNIEKISGWLDEVTKYRNAVNAQTLSTYYGYFDLRRFLMVTAQSMLLSGLLYKHLDYSDIGKLQVISSELSEVGETLINREIEEAKLEFVQAKAAGKVDFWESKFNQHRQTLQQIVDKLP